MRIKLMNEKKERNKEIRVKGCVQRERKRECNDNYFSELKKVSGGKIYFLDISNMIYF